jgi:hypothetical protein
MQRIEQYINLKGLVPLPPQVTEKLFEVYMGGSSLAEIARMYTEYDSGAICYTAYHYDWPGMRDDLTIDLQSRIKQKILHSKFQQLELVDSMIKVAHTEAMQSFQSYLKFPNDRNLPKTFRIKSIKDLQSAIDMMSTIVGQDNVKKIEMIEGKPQDNSPKTDSTGKVLSEETAKDLLTALNKKKSEV